MIKSLIKFSIVTLLFFNCNSSKLKTYEYDGKVYGEKHVVDDVDAIYKKLTETYPNLDRNNPIVILYFFKKDPCNSSGSTNKKILSAFFNDLENKIVKIANSQPIYIYEKYDRFLEKYRGVLDLKKDPQNFIHNHFFKDKALYCGGYVLLSPKGNYISFFSEYSKVSVLKRLRQLPNKRYKADN